jgi:recombination protein RecA|tara:strand:- start:3720 stop:4835 length:1116 start_codon:yes stop_codon:yes gene_type:complete
MAKSKAGRLNIADMKKLINKKVGFNVAFSLKEDNPTQVEQFIPTGCKWLDGVVCRGKWGGIPVGKISEIAGLEATGKSYMAAQIAGNAQKLGIDVIYFDSESAIDPGFLENAGCNVENLLYVQASSVEFVLETIESLLTNNDNQMLFIWDSLAMTPSVSDIESDFNPLSTMAVKPRILSKGMAKLVQPLANKKATLLVLNQLKTNITRRPAEALTTPYFTPGGKALVYAYSLRVWLTARKGKASFIYDDKGFRIGTEVKAKIEKSRFGTQGRECSFKIVWGGQEVKIMDKESWLEAIKSSEHINNAGAWFSLKYEDGTEEKFQSKSWLKKLEDEKFYNRVIKLLEDEVVMKFDKRLGTADEFYDVDNTEPE